MELSGRIAAITGAGSGIGRATALRFAKEGASIVVLDTDPAWSHDTVSMVKKLGGQALFIETDVRKEAQVEHAVDETLRAFGKIDILVNNAGIARTAKIIETTEAMWDDIIDTNLKGTFLMSKHVIPHLIRANGGVIINTASDAGIVGFANLGAYCASKGGIIQLTRALAIEYGEHKIRVNAVAPTSTLHTRMLDRVLDAAPDREKLHKALADSHPLKRLGTAEEIAELMLYLASDRSAYVTGAVFSIDGGITAACPVASF